jgi:hypothetical protein
MLIAGGLLAIGVLAIIGVVLLSIERRAAPELQTVSMPSRATVPLQQVEDSERVHANVPLTPGVRSDVTDSEDSSNVSEEEMLSVPMEKEQLYEIVKQLQQLQLRVETLERHLERRNTVPDAFDHYEDQDASVLQTMPVAVHNDSHQ